MHIVTALSAQYILDVITVVAVILNKVYFSSSHRVHLTESHGILRGHFSLLYFISTHGLLITYSTLVILSSLLCC